MKSFENFSDFKPKKAYKRTRKSLVKNVTTMLNGYMTSKSTWEECKTVFGLATKQEIIRGLALFMAQIKHEHNKTSSIRETNFKDVSQLDNDISKQ